MVEKKMKTAPLDWLEKHRQHLEHKYDVAVANAHRVGGALDMVRLLIEEWEENASNPPGALEQAIDAEPKEQRVTRFVRQAEDGAGKK